MTIIKMLNNFLNRLSESPNPRNFHKMINLFKHATKNDQVDHPRYSKFFTSPEMYARVIQLGFTDFIDMLRSYYQVDDYFTKDHIESNQILQMLRSFLMNALKFIESTINSQEEDESVLLFTIKALGKLHYVLPLYEGLQKKGFTFLVQLYTETLSLQLKLQSFLEIRKLFQTLPEFKQQLLLRKLYKSFEQSAKHVTWRTYQAITFTMNCLTELFGFNMEQSYQLLYSSMKQFVQQMHALQQNKNDENVRKVFCQQTLFKLRLWVKVVNQFNSIDQLGDLVYPLVQTIQGVQRFQTSTEYYPLLLHLNDLLIKLAQRNILKVPLMCMYLLSSADLKRKKKKTGAKHYDFEIGIQLKQKHKISGEFWSDFCGKVCEQLIIYLAIHSRSISFPEESYVIEKQLRSLEKQLGFDGNRIRLRKLIKMIIKHRTDILEWRKSKGSRFPLTQLRDIERECTQFTPTQLVKKFIAASENEFESQAQRIQSERDQEIKRRVIAEKDRVTAQEPEDLSSEEQEIEDDKDQQYVFDEIRKEREQIRTAQQELEEYDGEVDLEGDPDDEQNQS